MQHCDLVVVGAGVTGLYAARLAERAGRDVTVLEAADRIGGRVMTVAIAEGRVVDAGAQLLNGDMARLLALVVEAGGEIHPVPASGAIVLVQDQRATRVDAAASILPRLAAASERGEVPRGTLAAWLDTLGLDAGARRLAESEISEMYGQPTARLDAVGACNVARSYASARNEGEFQLAGGMAPVFTHLARTLALAPALATPVRAIAEDGDGVTVRTERATLRARHVVVAVTPPVAARIDIACADADAVHSALASWIAGDLIKFHLFYRRAFWRDRGLAGAAALPDTLGLSVLDTSLDAPRLTAFLGGTLAREWAARSEAERTRDLCHALAQAFGPDALAPLTVHQTVWIDHPWYGGAYHAHLRAGANPQAMKILCERRGCVRFAAAELTQHFAGYIEGGLESAERAVASLA